jgi:Tol biopolymer transport system component
MRTVKSLGLFVVNVNGTGLRQITSIGGWPADWSPQRNEIVFSQHATPDARSSIWVVQADGSGLREVHVQAQPACGGAFSDPGSQGCFDPNWSPDGTKVVFSEAPPPISTATSASSTQTEPASSRSRTARAPKSPTGARIRWSGRQGLAGAACAGGPSVSRARPLVLLSW